MQHVFKEKGKYKLSRFFLYHNGHPILIQQSKFDAHDDSDNTYVSKKAQLNKTGYI